MVVGLIHDIPTVKELIDRIMADAERIIRQRLTGFLDGAEQRPAARPGDRVAGCSNEAIPTHGCAWGDCYGEARLTSNGWPSAVSGRGGGRGVGGSGRLPLLRAFEGPRTPT